MIRNSAASAVYKSKRKRIETRLVRTENTSVQPKLTHTHTHTRAGHTSVRTHMSVCGYNGKGGLSGRALCAVAATEVAENENCCLHSGAVNKADFSCSPRRRNLSKLMAHMRALAVFICHPLGAEWNRLWTHNIQHMPGPRPPPRPSQLIQIHVHAP